MDSFPLGSVLPSFPERSQQAFTLLEDAERRLLRLRKGHFLRKEGMKAITHSRQVAERAGLKPPARRGARLRASLGAHPGVKGGA